MDPGERGELANNAVLYQSLAVMRIKGTFLADYVKIVKDTPELDWDSFLTDKDREIINSAIIPTEWYPAETMGMHGRARATDAFDDATKMFLMKDDPVASLRTYAHIVGRYIDEIKVSMERGEEGYAEVSFHPVETAPAWRLFREIQAGTLEKLVELNGGTEARGEFRTERREGREACIICISWK